MTGCLFCNTVEKRTKLEKIYEDDTVLAVVHPRPATPGHIVVFPKKHYTILEQIPDYEISSIFSIVNKLSIAVFEATKSAGTNIIVQNGVAADQEVPHVSINIIPRREKDDLNFQWEPKQLTEEQLSAVEVKVKEAAKDIGQFETEKKKEAVKIDKKPEKIKEEKDKINYLIKQLERIP